jgi:hypothetical protein
MVIGHRCQFEITAADNNLVHVGNTFDDGYLQPRLSDTSSTGALRATSSLTALSEAPWRDRARMLVELPALVFAGIAVLWTLGNPRVRGLARALIDSIR